MSLFKKKQPATTSDADDNAQKKCQEENGDSCPLCHVSDDIVNQLKGSGDTAEKEDNQTK